MFLSTIGLITTHQAPPPPPAPAGATTATPAHAAASPIILEGDGGDIVGGRRVRVKDIEIEPMPETQRLR